MSRLYHGTDEAGYAGIRQTGRIKSRGIGVFFTPDRNMAEEYGDFVVEVNVDDAELMIDCDLPGQTLRTVGDANEYLENVDWTIDDYLSAGHSVAIPRDVIIP